jgi:endogenous inhibitor of DNA gyrase (YacG/DUF329 family)
MTYRVAGPLEEFECPNCGAPVLDGERAYQANELAAPFCSKRCHDLNNADRQAEDAHRDQFQD